MFYKRMQEKYADDDERFPERHQVRLNKNAYIEYRFMTVEHSLHWDYNGWFNQGCSCDEYKELRDLVWDTMGKKDICVCCGSDQRIERHHIVQNWRTIHPSKQRFLQDITIPLCYECHNCRGGAFHRFFELDYQTVEMAEIKENVDFKVKRIGELLDEVNQLSLNYEIAFAKTYLEHINNMIEQRKEEKKDPLWTKEKENFEYSQLFQSAPQCALPEVQVAQQSIVRFRDKRGNPQHPDHDTEKAHFPQNEASSQVF